jgi:hypothetical protein
MKKMEAIIEHKRQLGEEIRGRLKSLGICEDEERYTEIVEDIFSGDMCTVTIKRTETEIETILRLNNYFCIEDFHE